MAASAVELASAMIDSSKNQQRPWWVRSILIPSGPRAFHILRCRLTIPIGLFFCLSVGIGVYWEHGERLMAHPRRWLVVVICSIFLLLGVSLSVFMATWLYLAIRWMDRNQLW